ncbi:MAG: HAD family hydrolase [Acidobacteriota bacterium]|nr:MAG: HAD family hydrolase [Acidobacteriota bacterium]
MGESVRKPAAVLFDLDGVIVDTFDVWEAVLEQCRAVRGLAPLGRQRIRECWGQGIVADCETLFPGTDPRRLAGEYERAFSQHLPAVRTICGAPEAIRTARRAGARLAVVTNSPAGLARDVLSSVGLIELFDAICGGDEVPRGKPDPALVRLALARLSIAPSEALMIGDSPLDVEAARQAGVLAIGYRVDGDLRLEQLDQLEDLVHLT